ncbi:MAG: phosphoribosyltransferase [Planctomycetota bacterium]|jgi:hypoxanthine phosphoribosyltransferase
MPYSRILVSTERLEEIVSCLARKIHDAYQGVDNCLALVVLDGAKYFAEDLLAQLDFPLEVESIKASSYSGTNSTGTVTIDKKDALKSKICGKNVLLIDDIYDSGLTLSRILEWLYDCRPQSVKTCVLLEKKIGHTKKTTIDFLGTKIEDVFAIGYGLDYEGQYRELPFIGELSEECIGRNEPDRKA